MIYYTIALVFIVIVLNLLRSMVKPRNFPPGKSRKRRKVFTMSISQDEPEFPTKYDHNQKELSTYTK